MINLQNYILNVYKIIKLDGNLLMGNLNEVYPMRVIGDGRKEGSNTVYKVQLFGDKSLGVPAERLLAGERFSIDFSPVEAEGSRKFCELTIVIQFIK